MDYGRPPYHSRLILWYWWRIDRYLLLAASGCVSALWLASSAQRKNLRRLVSISRWRHTINTNTECSIDMSNRNNKQASIQHYGTYAMNPLVLALCRIERASLQPLELERELWPELLDASRLAALKDVSMMPEEDEVALVVEGRDATALELGHLREERLEDTAHRVAETRVEVVEHEFRQVGGREVGVLVRLPQ